MRNNNLLLIMSVVTAALTLSPSCTSKKKSDHSMSELMTVDVALPQVDTVVLHKSYPGYLSADKSVDIVARVDGSIVRKHYSDGQYVKKGDLLFSIEDSKYVDAVNQAESQLQTAIATNNYATNQYKAMKKALESDAVSQMDVIQAESAMKESEASIKNARAALQSARTTLGYCSVRSPLSGHVSASTVVEGNYVSGSGAPVKLATVYDDKTMKAMFSVEDARYLSMIDNRKAGKVDYDHVPVTFTDTLPHSYTGRLDYMAPSIDTSTGTMSMRLVIDNPYNELKDGMYVVVGFPYEVCDSAILVSDAAIGTDQLGKYLYVVNDSNKVVYTPIKVSELVGDTLRIVTEGLSPRDRYVTKALLKVRNGMEVKPRLSTESVTR